MLDSLIRPYATPSLDKIAARADEYRIAAPLVTLTAFGIGLIGCFFVAIHSYLFGLILIAANRALHGLSAAMARRQGPSSFGAYLDMICSFSFYAAFVFFFIISSPAFHLAGAFLLMSYVVLAGSHLAGLWMRAAGIEEVMEEPADKAVIVESVELSLFMFAACLFPVWFPAMAFLFGLLCLATAVQRALRAWHHTMQAAEAKAPRPAMPEGRIKTQTEQDLENSGI